MNEVIKKAWENIHTPNKDLDLLYQAYKLIPQEYKIKYDISYQILIDTIKKYCEEHGKSK